MLLRFTSVAVSMSTSYRVISSHGGVEHHTDIRVPAACWQKLDDLIPQRDPQIIAKKAITEIAQTHIFMKPPANCEVSVQKSAHQSPIAGAYALTPVGVNMKSTFEPNRAAGER